VSATDLVLGPLLGGFLTTFWRVIHSGLHVGMVG
jgi:hypothetical protein